MAQIDPAASQMKKPASKHYDRSHPNHGKIFLCYFSEGIMHNSHLAAEKMKENFLKIEYDNSSLETSSR